MRRRRYTEISVFLIVAIVSWGCANHSTRTAKDASARCGENAECNTSLTPDSRSNILFTLRQVFRPSNILPSIGKTHAGQEITLGGFSGLAILKRDGDRIVALTHTDRGPNPEPDQGKRPFALPDFNPRLVFLEINMRTSQFQIIEQVSLRAPDGRPLNGLPPKTGRQEQPVDIFGRELPWESYGIDPESVAVDPRGGYWLSEEYGPSLLRFDPSGKEIMRLSPGRGLPEIYASRAPNRGFEAMAISKGKAYAFLQSPLPNEDLRGRIAEVDLQTYGVREYVYNFESEETARIGDVTSLPNGQLLVIEQNNKAGPQSRKFVYRLTLAQPNHSVQEELLLDLAKAGFPFQKAEGLAVVDAKHLLILNDNDFGVDGLVNFKTGIFPTKAEEPRLFLFETEAPLWRDE